MSDNLVHSATPQVSERSAVRSPWLPDHRIISGDTTTENAKSPVMFQEDLSSMAPTLSYGQPASGGFTDKQEELAGEDELEHEASSAEEGVKPKTRWARIKWQYDVWYHRLRLRWPFVLAFVLSGSVCASIAIGWSFRLQTFNIVDPDSEHNAVVQLSANIVDVDPLVQQMILDWNIHYDCERIGCPDVNIFFDANTLRSDSASTSTQSNVKPSPIFSIIGGNVRAMDNNTDRKTSSLTFRTDIAVSNANTHRTLQSYPYDKYLTQLVFFAEDAATNESVSITIVRTTGIAVGFNIELQNTTDITDNFGTTIKNIEVTRGLVVRLYAIFIVLAVWLVTLTFMATCVLNVFFGKGISSGVLVLPMGTLFAFTQLRSTLPGAPVGFGAIIDFVGLLPCLAILTFCSIFMTAIFLLRNPEHDIARWQWKQPGGRKTSMHNDSERGVKVKSMPEV